MSHNSVKPIILAYLLYIFYNPSVFINFKENYILGKNRMYHIITIVCLAIFIVLGLASGTTGPATNTENSGDEGTAKGRNARPRRKGLSLPETAERA